tara:strand:+ start:5907 stop:6281 length:375 start_codon:yes stop_codon:yes gene_type:complete
VFKLVKKHFLKKCGRNTLRVRTPLLAPYGDVVELVYTTGLSSVDFTVTQVRILSSPPIKENMKRFTVFWSKNYYTSGHVEIEAENEAQAISTVDEQIGDYEGSMQYDADNNLIEVWGHLTTNLD